MQRGTTRKFSTTPGTRDILPPESTRLLDVQARILERFLMHGFREVISPALEYSEVVEEPKLRDASFKLFDPDNQMLLLRPEMTTPIARLVTQRLRNAPTPHKLSYALPVYRRTGVGRGQSAEFHQAGVEIVGSTSPGEDAGTIALLIETLESLGLRAPRDFVLVLGQAAFYEGYLRRVAPEVASELLEALAAKDLVRVDEISADVTVEAAGLREIPRLVGPATDASVLERATRYANGGRYDNLLRRFGEPLPATGFAISLERLISLLPKEEPSPLLVLVGGTVEAIRLAAELRSSGVPVLHLAEDLAPETAVGYACSVEASWVGYPAPDGLELAPAEPGGRFELTATEKVFGRLLS